MLDNDNESGCEIVGIESAGKIGDIESSGDMISTGGCEMVSDTLLFIVFRYVESAVCPKTKPEETSKIRINRQLGKIHRLLRLLFKNKVLDMIIVIRHHSLFTAP